MKQLIFATGNQAKVEDASRVLSEIGIKVVGKKLDFEERQTLDQEDVVKNKASQAYEKLKQPLLVDDTAFFLNSYPQFPGTLTKYVNRTLGISGLIKLFEEGQTAYFRTLLCFIDGENEIIAEGSLSGRLTRNVSKNFDQDTPINSIFIPDGFNRPLIDLINDSGIGNRHRINALANLCQKLRALKFAGKHD